jgi:hypothetical protein
VGKRDWKMVNRMFEVGPERRRKGRGRGKRKDVKQAERRDK